MYICFNRVLKMLLEKIKTLIEKYKNKKEKYHFCAENPDPKQSPLKVQIDYFLMGEMQEVINDLELVKKCLEAKPDFFQINKTDFYFIYADKEQNVFISKEKPERIDNKCWMYKNYLCLDMIKIPDYTKKGQRFRNSIEMKKLKNIIMF